MAAKRLDVILVEQGFFSSREHAKRACMAGEVFVNEVREDKAGTRFDDTKPLRITVKTDPLPFVSRGGLKLQKALSIFPISLDGVICLDIGASTGGFTDCMLQAGAAKVYAVDVGYGQLAYPLRTDKRVVCMERTNFRKLTGTELPEKVGFAGADVSFISLDKILPVAALFLEEDASMVCLIKPQFEAGREKVGKHGVVRDQGVHEEVIERVMGYALAAGFSLQGLSYSPVTGPKGNIEYLLHIKKIEPDKEQFMQAKDMIRSVVKEAHGHFE